MSGEHLSTNALVDAISSCDGELVQRLLDAGADPNTKSTDGISALCLAIKAGSQTIMSLLLDAGAEVNARPQGRKGVIALHLITMDTDTDFTTFKWKADILFKFGADPDACDHFRRTALQQAAGKGKRDEILYLIEKGANVDLGDDSGWTALMHACFFAQKESLYVLLDSNVNLNAVSVDGRSAVGFLASSIWKNSEHGRVEGMMERLLEAGADPNIGGGHYIYPLQAAAHNSPPELGYCRLLLKYGADPLAEGGSYFNALQAAICNLHHSDCKDVVKTLLEAGVPLNTRNDEGETALSKAIESHCGPEVIAMLLNAGADIHLRYNQNGGKGYTALGHAVARHDEATVEMLIQRGASLDTLAGTPGYCDKDLLVFASCNSGSDDARIVSMLLKAGADPNKPGEYGRTPLQVAALGGHLAVAQVLLDHGADINAGSSWRIGGTALHYAAEDTEGSSSRFMTKEQQAKMIALLLKAGSDVHAVNGHGALALHRASRQNSTKDAFRQLLDAGGLTTVDHRDSQGRTPLHEAVEGGALEIVREILKYKNFVGINAQDSEGQTPLHLAAKKGYEDIVCELLSGRVNIRAKDSSGKTALMYASSEGHFRILQYLKDAQQRQSKFSFRNLYLFSICFLLLVVIWNRF